MSNQQSDDAAQSAWASLGAVEQAKEWEAFRPGTFQEMFDSVASLPRKQSVTRKSLLPNMKDDWIT